MLMFMFSLIYPLYPLSSSGKQTAEDKAVVGRHHDTTSTTTTIRSSTSVNRQREMRLQQSDFPLQAKKSHQLPCRYTVFSSGSNKNEQDSYWRSDQDPHLFAMGNLTNLCFLQPYFHHSRYSSSHSVDLHKGTT